MEKKPRRIQAISGNTFYNEIYCHAFPSFALKTSPTNYVFKELTKQNQPNNIPNNFPLAIWEISKEKNADDEKKNADVKKNFKITNFQNLMGFMSGSGYNKKF